jgi:hypothetical protein
MLFSRTNVFVGIAVAIMAVASLSGCATANTTECHYVLDQEEDQFDIDCAEEIFDRSFTVEEAPKQSVFINLTTGFITKVVDSDGVVKFEDGYTDSDLKVESPLNGYRTYGTTATSVVDINGSPSEVNATLSLSFSMESLDFLVSYHNQHIAKPYDNKPIGLEVSSIADMVQSVMVQEIQAGFASGEIPSFQVSTNGYSATTTDSRVANLWQAGVSAAKAAESLDAPPVPGYTGNFRYSFDCAVYGVNYDSSLMLAALNERFQSPESAGSVQLALLLPTRLLTIESSTPCKVVEDNPTQKDSSVNPTPPQGTYLPPRPVSTPPTQPGS